MHIQKLKKILISFGILDSITTCKCTATNSVMKVVKGAMVSMKSKKVECLRRIIGNTIIGGALSNGRKQFRWNWM